MGGMKKLSTRKIIMLLAVSVSVAGGLVVASINPAETSPQCMPAYIKEEGSDECVSTSKSKGASIEVINTDE